MSEPAIISRAPFASGKRVLEPRQPAPLEPIASRSPEPGPAQAADAAANTAHRQEIAEAVAAARAEIEGEHLRFAAQERDRARETGRAEGLLEGREAALEEARAARLEEAGRLRTVLESIDRARARLLDGAEETAVAIGFAAACRILGESLLTPGGVRAAVQTLLAQASGVEHAVVRLHPDDLARIREIEAADAFGPVRLVADAAVGVGDCCVDTSAGTLESRLQTRIAELRDALLAAHRAPEEEKA